jgi:hypothetical protein
MLRSSLRNGARTTLRLEEAAAAIACPGPVVQRLSRRWLPQMPHHQVWRDTPWSRGAPPLHQTLCSTVARALIAAYWRPQQLAWHPPRVHSNITAQRPLRADGEHVAEDEHPDHQHRIDRWSTEPWIIRCQLGMHPTQIENSAYGAQCKQSERGTAALRSFLH